MNEDVKKDVETGKPPGGKPAGVNHVRNNRGLYRERMTEKFEGACQEMKGFIFDVNPVRSMQITHNRKTLERLKIVIGKEYKKPVLKAIKGMDLKILKDENQEPQPVYLDAEQTRMSDGAKIKYKSEMDTWTKKTEKLEAETNQVYNLVLGQCTDTMISRLKEMTDFAVCDEENDPVKLLTLISNVTLSFSTSTEPIMATWLAKWEFVRMKQGERESNQDYFERFVSMHDMNVSVGIDVNKECEESIVTAMADENNKDKDLLDSATKDSYRAFHTCADT